MEQCSPLGWLYYPQQEDMGEPKRFLVQTTMEMEATILTAQDEILRKEEELAHMRDLLMLALKERDEAQYKCQKLLVEKHHLLLNSVSLSTLLVPTNDQKKALLRDTKTSSLSSSNSDETIISEPHLVTPSSSSSTLSSSLPPNYLAAALGKQRTLPEKGRLLQAVMEAGPILQTLLLAGPLPQWQHPPPQLHRIEIPPVTIPPSPNKRGLGSCFDGSVCSSPNYSKYQRVA